MVTYSVLITIRITDVQTDVHFVPVDSDSPTRKLAVTLIYQCKWCIVVAQTYSPPAPSLVFQLNYSIDLQAFYLQQSMWVDNMVDKSCASYLYQKRSVYYFSKQVPCDVRQHYKRDRIVISLKTKSVSSAKRMCDSILQRLHDSFIMH